MPEPKGLSGRYTTLVVAAVSFVVLSCVAFLVPVPYSIMSPGPTFDTLGEYRGDPMFEVDAETYSTEGSLDFTTVNISGADAHMTFAEAVQAWFSPHTKVVPDSVAHPEAEEDSHQIGARQLASSKENSQVAALRAADYEVHEYAEVASVSDDGTAAGTLKADDAILTVDDTDIATADDVVDAVGAQDVGDTVTMKIRRGGDSKEVSVDIGEDPDDASKPRIGIEVGRGFDLPISVSNNIDDAIEGSSAGMMFALSIYDRLVPESLTGGENIAGTGVITPEGEVIPIGGVRQKMAGAHNDGASVFLLPADNCADALDGDDFGMRLVSVSTLDDAIEALEKLADDPDATVPTCQ